MADISHKTLGYAEAHVFHFDEYANAAARTGAAGLATADLKKIALQTDDDTFWMLKAIGPPLVWVQVMGTFYSQAEVQALITKAIPVGSVEMCMLTTAPTGWLFLNGETMGDATSGGDNASADYATLFALLKTTEVWGDHDTVTLPDMTDSFPLGAAASLGATGGAATKDISHTHAAHTHTGPSHTHTIPITGYGGSNAGGLVSGAMQADNAGNIWHATTQPESAAEGTGATAEDTPASAGSAAQDIIPPYVKMNYMIRYAAY